MFHDTRKSNILSVSLVTTNFYQNLETLLQNVERENYNRGLDEKSPVRELINKNFGV